MIEYYWSVLVAFQFIKSLHIYCFSFSICLIFPERVIQILCQYFLVPQQNSLRLRQKYLSVYHSNYLFFFPSIYSSFYLSIIITIYLPILNILILRQYFLVPQQNSLRPRYKYLSIYSSFYLSILLSIYVYTILTICLPILNILILCQYFLVPQQNLLRLR